MAVLTKKIKKAWFKVFNMASVNRHYRAQPAVFESIGTPDPKKLFVIVLAFNQPELIKLHYAAMRKFLRDEHEYFIMDNSSDESRSREIREFCLDRHIHYVRLPKNPGIDESTNPGFAFNWIYRNLVERLKPARFGFIDSDLFPVEPVSIDPYLDDGEAWGIITERKPTLLRPLRRPVWYLWLGLLFFRRERFAGRAPDFLPGEWGIDAGGKVRVDPREIMKLPDVHDLHREYRWTEVAPGVKVIMYGKFAHFTGASWMPHNLEAQKKWMAGLVR